MFLFFTDTCVTIDILKFAIRSDRSVLGRSGLPVSYSNLSHISSHLKVSNYFLSLLFMPII